MYYIKPLAYIGGVRLRALLGYWDTGALDIIIIIIIIIITINIMMIIIITINKTKAEVIPSSNFPLSQSQRKTQNKIYYNNNVIYK